MPNGKRKTDAEKTGSQTCDGAEFKTPAVPKRLSKEVTERHRQRSKGGYKGIRDEPALIFERINQHLPPEQMNKSDSCLDLNMTPLSQYHKRPYGFEAEMKPVELFPYDEDFITPKNKRPLPQNDTLSTKDLKTFKAKQSRPQPQAKEVCLNLETPVNREGSTGRGSSFRSRNFAKPRILKF